LSAALPPLPSPADAERVILSSLPLLPTEHCPLASAHGRILRAAIHADRDLPPFNRVTMDGFALRAAAVAAGTRRFRVSGLQAAGMVPQTLVAATDCIEIATGAIQPHGADAIIPYEEGRREDEHFVLPDDASVAVGQHLHVRGSDHRAGETLVTPGTRLSGREIAVAASCGRAFLSVGLRPRVAVVATGDELVEVDAHDIALHQVRKSNDYAVRAALLASNAVAQAERFHLRDQQAEIEQGLHAILAGFDAVILTGGVSRGKFDFVPTALASLGVEKRLQGIAQRPGKPFWFGLSPRRTPVFALPGNPVSTYTCLHRYVLPALAQMSGATPPAPDYVPLANAVSFKPPLAWLPPVRLSSGPDGRRTADTSALNTSGDFGGLVGTDGFVELPPGPGVFPAGTGVRFWAWS
jgi:molybdopterin molybdotransferase